MSYHNVRDKAGRFTSKKRTRSTMAAIPRKPTNRKPKNHILNVFLLDDTGSMSSKVSATIEGFNSVLADAVKASKETGVKSTDMLMLFGGKGHLIVKNTVDPLTPHTYRPSHGATALYWAIVDGIIMAEDRLKSMPPNTKVIFTIFTDGENNQAPEYWHPSRTAIQHKQGEGWVINFIGAGSEQEVRRMSDSVGIFASNSLNYMNDSKGTRTAFRKMSDSRSAYTAKVAAGMATVDGFFSND